MGLVEKKLMVDSEVAAVSDAIVKLCEDIKAKKSVGEDASDLMAILLPELGNIANIPDHVKANKDDRKYLAMALEQAAEVFLMPAPAPAAPAAAPQA